jgi:hypothetical protein
VTAAMHSSAIGDVVADLRKLMDTKSEVPDLLGCAVLYSLGAVERRSGGSANPGVRAGAIRDVLRDAVSTFGSPRRKEAMLLLGLPPFQEIPAARRKRQAAETAGHQPDYYRKHPTSRVLTAVATKLLEWEEPSHEEADLGLRDESGITRYFSDFVSITQDWQVLFETSKSADLVLNYGATWRNTYLKLMKEMLRAGGRLRIVLPETKPRSHLVQLYAGRLGLDPEGFRARVTTAIEDFLSLKGRVEIYQTAVAFHHAIYLFDTGGVLALYALCGSRMRTPAAVVGEGDLLSFMRDDFEELLRRSERVH